MQVFKYEDLLTEQRNPHSAGLDQMTTIELLRVINEEDKTVPVAVSDALPEIARAVELIVERLKKGGRVLYIGAGTSGRIGIIDAAECPPTFGVDHDLISAVIAGGPQAVFCAVEESEDDEDRGSSDAARVVTPNHVVVGISASGVTPYVRGALKAAQRKRAGTVALICSRPEMLNLKVDVTISVLVGPEVLTGSTRMKAGTAQKLVLNMLSTASMVRLGKVYDNLMVDVRPTNSKLRARAVRIISMATGLDLKGSSDLLARSGGNIKVALVMELADSERRAAEAAIAQAGGQVRLAIELAKKKHGAPW